MFYKDEIFFDEISDVIADIEYKEEMDIEDLPEDYTIELELCRLEPLFKLNSIDLYEILLRHFEDRSSDDGEEWDGIADILKKHIDFDALNADIPKLWFPTNKTTVYSKKHLIELK